MYPGQRAPARMTESIEQAADLDGHQGLVILPRGARALLVLGHGAGAGMRHPFLGGLAQALARSGVATLRWEFSYMTQGRRLPDRPLVAQASVRTVWQTARARWGDLAMFGGGKSFGGRMTSTAHAASSLDGLRGLVFIGFPLHPRGRPGVERAAHLLGIDCPMLMIQGARDELAERELMQRVVAGLGSRATFHVIEGADHAFTPRPASGAAHVIQDIAGIIATWIANRHARDR